MAETRVEDLDADFIFLGRGNLDVFDREGYRQASALVFMQAIKSLHERLPASQAMAALH